ncbi:Hpt domain-containing protein, partial [Cylindrospermum sp. FACHB-282]|uniref:Hpt domain-containing protein n=1 Tax=Cylindrospermum sp. FACHB-282 TaxID=2692794 RepID=UPI001681C4F9
MLPEQQQRILGYFLEEARDHLNTIEQGLLNLQSTLNDPEMINEVFRAAHSIKGGAAMLGLNSIQHTAHRLEDCFKVLKDNPVQVDEKLESLFLGVSDTLKVLLEHLSGPFGLSEEAANTLMSETEPVFRWLNEHLEELVEQGNSGVVIAVPTTERQLASVNGGTTPTQMLQRQDSPNREVDTSRPSPKTSGNENWGEFQATVLQTLREMLQLFKQTTTPSTRQNLQQCCQQLVQLGTAHNLPHWSGLCQAAASAIASSTPEANANPDNTYLTLAKIVITEIKKAQELVLQGRETEIAISPQLNALIAISEIESLEITPDLVAEQPQAVTEVVSTFEPATPELQPQNSINHLDEDTGNSSSDKLPEETPASALTPTTFAASPLLNHEEVTLPGNSSIDTHGPVVGIAELNSLADLFEGESPELDETWQHEETLDIIAANQLGMGNGNTEDDDNDLADLLRPFDEDTSNEHRQTTTTSTEELKLLFGDNFLDKENSEPQNQPTSAETVEVSNIFSSELNVDILEEFTVISSDSLLSPVENDVVEDLSVLTLPQNQPTSDETVEISNIFSSELNVDILEEFTVISGDSPSSPVENDVVEDLLVLTLDDNESLPTGEVTPPETENIASLELSSEPESSFDNLLNLELTNAESLEELIPSNSRELGLTSPQPESSTSDNLFAELEENTPLPTDELEIGDLFDSPTATAAELSTSEDELSSFWNPTNEAQPTELDSVVEEDVARDLEESLFAAAVSDDIFADSQQSIPSSTASLDLEDFEISFLQPEPPQDFIFTSDAGDNLFDDLAASDSTNSPAIGDGEVSLPEIRSFSQEPEALDFMPEFTNQAPETTAADSSQSFAGLQTDLFGAVEENSDESLSLGLEEADVLDATYIQPDFTETDADNLFGRDTELDVSVSEQTPSSDLFGNLL